MKTNKVLSAVLIVLTALALASCTGKKFHVSGVITDAKDSLLYFENMSLNGIGCVSHARSSTLLSTPQRTSR